MRHAILLAAGALLLSGRAAAGQQTFHDPAHGFTLRAPANWRPLPDSMVREISRQASAASGTAVTYVAGYQVDSTARWGDLPYVLVQAAETPGITEEAFVRAMTGSGQARMRSAVSRMGESLELGGLSLDQPTWDSAAHVMWVPTRAQAPDGHHVEGLSAFRLKRNGFVGIHYYDSRPDSLRAAMLPLVDALVFDPGAAYQPLGRPRPQWTNALLPAAIGGALIGLVVAFLLRRRRRPA
jgi:hypothetical protein